MTPLQIIANPAAGRGRGARSILLIEQQFGAAGLKFEIHRTDAPGQAADLARALHQAGHRTLVALGGDGTINEVVNGLLRSAGTDRHSDANATLGVLPAGSANDFCFSFGLPADLEAAGQRIIRGRVRTTDVGLLEADNGNPRFFVNGIGVGFDAVICMENRKVRWPGGPATYLLALLRTLALSHSAPRTRVLCDGEVYQGESLMISVMNGRRLGGVFQMAPQALCDDGLLDVVLSSRMRRLEILRLIPAFIRGTQARHSELIKTVRARRIVIDIEGSLPAHVDGEVYSLGARHYEMHVYPHRLRVIC